MEYLSKLILILSLVGCTTMLSAGQKKHQCDKKRCQPQEFKELSIHTERNETDNDAEVVIVAKGFEGLKRIRVFNPDDKRIANLKSKHTNRVGLAEIIIESGEPSIEDVLVGFPEGDYQVVASTVSGVCLLGVVTLSHDLLLSPQFSVNPADAIVEWFAVDGAAGYIVEIEQDDLAFNLTTTVDAEVLGLKIPGDLLLPGVEYEISIATITENGNISLAEDSFETPK